MHLQRTSTPNYAAEWTALAIMCTLSAGQKLLFLTACNINCNFDPDDVDALLCLRTGPPAKPRLATVSVLILLLSYTSTAVAAAATEVSSSMTGERRGSFTAAGAALNVVRLGDPGKATLKQLIGEVIGDAK